MQFRTTRLLAGALALLMMLSLAGCREKPGGTASSAGPEANSSGAAQTEPTETQPPEEVHLPILPLDDSQMADPAARVIDRAPLDGREGLTIKGWTKLPDEGFSLNYMHGAIGQDVYPNASPLCALRSICFSFARWDPDTFRLLYDPFRSVYQMGLREWTPERAPQLDPAAQPDALPYYVYASWRGMDWKALADLELAVLEKPDDAAAVRARDAFRDQYLEDFLALQPEDLPTLPFLYEIWLRFPPDAEGGMAVDERLPSLDGTVDDEDGCGHDAWIGGAAIHTEDPRSRQTPGLTLAQPGYEALVVPLNDGDCRVKAMEFTVGEDLTLHGFRLYRSNIEVRQITVARTGSGGMSEELWDGRSDFSVRAGETVALYLTLHDPEAENLVNVIFPDGAIHHHDAKAARPEDRVEYINTTLGEYCKDQFCILDYSAGDGTHTAATELALRREANPWETIFLIACDGDRQFSAHLYSYYIDYCNPLFNPAWEG